MALQADVAANTVRQVQQVPPKDDRESRRLRKRIDLTRLLHPRLRKIRVQSA